ncbi:DJ-1/PfpI family protein, partial [bacterium]|nr:DJ-1/PfpI family protein [bacterium]
MRAYLYILNTLSDWEIGYITSELNSGRYLNKPIELVKIGNTIEAIKTMGGISIVPDEIIENIEFNKGDLLILPGADTWMDIEHIKIVNIVAKLLDNQVIVAAICGATMALAQNKLLDDKKHTSNDKGFLKMVCSNYAGEDNYLERPVVIDNNLITANGLSSLEFSYEIFKKIGAM